MPPRSLDFAEPFAVASTTVGDNCRVEVRTVAWESSRVLTGDQSQWASV
jgi:hypothetical protein